MNLIDQISQTLTAEKISLGDLKFLLAVSGGKDSMVLLDALLRLKVDFIVAHVNYGLRNPDSNLDEELVMNVCKDKGIRCLTKKVDTKAFCNAQNVSTQEGARLIRYEWFDNLLKEEKLDFIITAHHKEDNKETFIQNLKRGSGLRGLKSMLVVHEQKIKPLLYCSREDIDNYALEEKIKFRQDASNNQNHYQRNLIRNEVLPALENFIPGIGQGISSSIEKLQLDYSYLQGQLEKESAEKLIKVDEQWVLRDFKSCHFRFIFHILETFGFNSNQTTDILDGKQTGKRIINDGFIASIHGNDLLIIDKPKSEASKKVIEITELGEYSYESKVLHIKEADIPSQFSSEKSIAYIDADSINYPLILETWKPGDRINPIGMKGSKKISDYLSDIKMPLHQKQLVYVLKSEGKIIWIVGEMVSDLVKITSKTKKVLKLETF